MEYLWIKLIHILGAILILGAGMGSAFYLFRANRSREIHSIYFAARNAVLADWIFTLPAVILLPVTGFAMVKKMPFSMTEPWLWVSVILYLIAGAAWLPAVYLQIRMRNLAKEAVDTGMELSPHYWRFERVWFWLGVIAFPSVAAILYLMVFKPTA